MTSNNSVAVNQWLHPRSLNFVSGETNCKELIYRSNYEAVSILPREIGILKYSTNQCDNVFEKRSKIDSKRGLKSVAPMIHTIAIHRKSSMKAKNGMGNKSVPKIRKLKQTDLMFPSARENIFEVNNNIFFFAA